MMAVPLYISASLLDYEKDEGFGNAKDPVMNDTGDKSSIAKSNSNNRRDGPGL